MKPDGLRKKLLSKKASLEEQRMSYEDQWRELADYTYPRQYRWLTTDWTNRGNKTNNKIIDPVATLSLRSMAAAFASSITPSSRPWKKLKTTSIKFADDKDVQDYLADCDEMLDEMILSSNFYQEATKVYEQVANFGTAAMLIEEDYETVFRCETFPAGSYWLGQNNRRQVDQFMRVFILTPAQMVDAFGIENLSDRTRLYAEDDQRRDTVKVEILHYIGPNDEYSKGSFDPAAKKFASIYMEVAGNDDKLLSQSGYEEFPVVTPRWKIYGDDVYGLDCPTMLARGHIKHLQHAHKQINKAIEKQVNPPLQGPESTRRKTVETTPGAMNTVPSGQTGEQIRPLYAVNFDINGAKMLVEDLRAQIKEIYFYNLFLMVANERRSGTKAREIDELHEEKMLMLAAVYDQLSQEFLNPCVTRFFNIAHRLGRLPEIPESFKNNVFTVEYVSVMAHAMKLVGIGNMDRAIAVLGQIGAARPEVMDLINFDKFSESYLDRLGIDSRVKNSKEEMDAIRKARAQQVAQRQQLESNQMQADTAKTLSDTKIESDNALGELLNRAKGL